MVVQLQQTKTNKKTELGTIPVDWKIKRFSDVLTGFSSGATPYRGKPEYYKGNVRWITSGELDYNIITDTEEKITEEAVKKTNLTKHPPGTFLIAITGLEAEGTRGRCGIIGAESTTNQSCMAMYPKDDFSLEFLFHYYVFKGDYLALKYCQGTKQQSYSKKIVETLPIIVPPTKEEQKRIANVLTEINELIIQLDKLIEKKKNVKFGTMQELLTGKRRLYKFNGKWKSGVIKEIANVLDNLRVPLNETQRSKMSGDIPYCGANGILDYVNNFVIDDDIILIAEDGGHFDEYQTRPIAYRMIGKCWVNNHAHILKSQNHIDQGFLFFSLVHKNILKYISGGTRSKLNKSELNKIEITYPENKQEQSSIAEILSDMDSEIKELEQTRDKYLMIKKGMMQKLLTGEIRLQ